LSSSWLDVRSRALEDPIVALTLVPCFFILSTRLYDVRFFGDFRLKLLLLPRNIIYFISVFGWSQDPPFVLLFLTLPCLFACLSWSYVACSILLHWRPALRHFVDGTSGIRRFVVFLPSIGLFNPSQRFTFYILQINLGNRETRSRILSTSVAFLIASLSFGQGFPTAWVVSWLWQFVS
jgi:hypothetical protein